MELLSRLNGTVSGSSGKLNGAVTASIEHLFLYVNTFPFCHAPAGKERRCVDYFFFLP
jgi:hypothetical protein